MTIPNSDGSLVRIYWEPFYDGHLESYEDGVRNTYGEGDLLPEGIFMVMGSHNKDYSIGREEIWRSFGDDDSSEEENERASFAREINLEMHRGEVFEEIQALNQLGDVEPQSDQLEPITEINNSETDLDQIRRGERIPRTVTEWLALVDHNMERERQGLDYVFPWTNPIEGTHPSPALGSDEEPNEYHFNDVPDHLSHMSLEDGVLRQVNDNSMSWQEHALIHDAPEGELSLNNLAMFQEEPHVTITTNEGELSSRYPLLRDIPSFLLPREIPNGEESMHPNDSSQIPTPSPTSLEMGAQSSQRAVLNHSSFPTNQLAILENMVVPFHLEKVVV